MANRAILEREMKEYCRLNGINDVAGFITQCMLNGFNIVKYGTSPADNIKREHQPELNVITNREVKKKPVEEEVKETPELKVTKRKVKVIKK